jgi:hypothetical protein
MFDEEMKEELGQQTDFSHRPEQRTAPLKLSAYAGKYENAMFGVVEIAENGGQPVLRSGPKLTEFVLQHWDRDVFTYQPTGESAGGLAGVRFSIDPSGEADRVLIENLNLHGQGTFSRSK